MFLFGTIQQTEDPKSLRDNEMYARTSYVIADDICSDNAKDTKVWVLNTHHKLWMNITCEQWKQVSEK